MEFSSVLYRTGKLNSHMYFFQSLSDGVWDKGSVDYGLSPAGRWLIREDYSDIKDYDQGMRLKVERKLGKTVTTIIEY